MAWRKAWDWTVRAYHHPMWIPALSVIAIVSLVGTLILGVMFVTDQMDEQDKQRETDQVICTLANRFRGQVVDIGNANEQLLQGVIDVVLPADATNGERAAAIREIRKQIEPVFVDYRAAVDEIRFINCAALPGAVPEPPR